ncbi:MAG: PucR family transcriptional regulator ligand-binding domain-containing protein, partial [Mycetocola sp.]
MSSIQLGDLLTHNPLGLRLRTPSTPELMRANVTWSHSSDLRDPGPFMEQGNVLLTTGAQLRDGSLTADDYVDLLCRAGVVALGFGDGVLGPCPPELLTACTRAGLPLFDVPYTTPFIAVSRHIAQLLSQAEHASDARALEAGRALSVAALKSDAVGGVVTELARQLGGWVALLNAEAQISVQAGTPLPLFSTVTAVTAEARRLLSRRQRSSVVLADQSDNSTEETTLQTLGRGDALRGVLVIRRHRTPRGDTATRIVVSQAVALIGVTLEHENRAAVQRAVI